MARKIIDIGVVGNDGTGDSIRDSFRKVNDNFRELYSSLGLGERLTFINLDDTPETYDGQLDINTGSTPLVTVNNTEDGVTFKRLIPGIGISIDYVTNPNEIRINSDFASIVADPNPQLGGDLSAQSGSNQYRILDLAVPTVPSEAVNKSYADTKIARAGIDAIDPATGNPNVAFGRMTGPLLLSRDPEPDDDLVYDGLIAATKRYVDGSAFASTVNLYVATSGQDERPGVSKAIQGRALAYAYRSLEAALKRAEELINEARVEIGPYKKVLTYGNGLGDCTLTDILPSPNSGTGFIGTVRMSVDSVILNNSGTNYYPGDILSLNGGTIPAGGGACTIEVLSTLTTPGAIATYRIISSGSYSALPGSTNIATTIVSSGAPSGIGAIGLFATFDVTYKVNSVNIVNGGSGYSLVSVRIVGGGGSGAFGTGVVSAGSVTSITITDRGSGFTSLPTLDVSLPRFYIDTKNFRTDFTGDVLTTTPETIRGRDIREGLYLRGESSGALAQIVAHSGELDSVGNELFDVDIKFGAFEIGEVISYGDISKNIQISVLVESGEYYENYPLKVPANVSIVGDEFRRVIFRPKSGTSSSPWAFQRFRRDKTIGTTSTTRDVYDASNDVWTTQQAIADQLSIANTEYGYHYLQDPTRPVYPKIQNPGGYDSAATLIELNRAFLQEEIISWMNYNIANSVSPFNPSFVYDQRLCKRDVGLLVDALIYDLKYGSYNRIISAGLKYYESDSARIAITTQLIQYLAVLAHLEELVQDIVQNTAVSVVRQTLYLQIIDPAFQAETGVDVVITDLMAALTDVMDGSGSVNYPLENDQMDVFLANDAVRWQAISAIGHGGFMGVLDPEGQILSRSPYFQECASFTKSIDRQTFAGGMFVDGFAGNLEFTITGLNNPGSSTRLQVTGLDRFPQLPASFIVGAGLYRINYVRDFVYDKDGSSATFVLDETTPWPFPIFTYNNDICYRDVGLIIDGLGYDIVFGTNYNTRLSGLTYRLSNAAVVLEDQREITLEAINYAHELVSEEVSAYPSVLTSVDLSNSIIADIIDRGTTAAPTLTFTLPPGLSANLTSAYNLLMINRDYIVAEVQGWIKAQIAGNITPWAFGDTYNEAKSQRDTRYVVEAVIYDLIYGGNSATRAAALKYYNNITGASMLASGQPARCAAALTYAAYLAGRVVQNLNPATAYSTLVRITGTPATATEATLISNLVTGITNTITGGSISSAPALVEPNLDAYAYSTTLKTARGLINSAKVSIQQSVVDYVDENGNKYELLMPGNRSMLANDFTQINDMGYGAIAANGGLLELVSVFTYYCYISYYSIRGGQIRSVAGSSAHGIYALVAEGADPLEVPTPTSLYEELAQKVVCYYPSPSYANNVNGLLIFVTGYDYTPLGGSELEINHNGIIFRYPVTSTTTTDLPPGVTRLNLSAGTGGTTEGLFASVPDGTVMTWRALGQVLLTGDLADVAVRPSTGLVLRETGTSVYRVLEFGSTDDSSGPFEVEITQSNPAIFKVLVTITNISSNVCTTSINHKLKLGDKFIAKNSGNNITAGVTYFIVDVPAYNQFKISTSPGGTAEILLNGSGLTIKGYKTHKLIENYSLTLRTSGALPSPLSTNTVYYVLATDLTDTEFAVSTQKNGTPIATTTAGTGTHRYAISGLTKTILRENYNYIDLTVWTPGEYVTSGSPCTISIGSPATITLATHGFVAGDVVKFTTTGSLPTGLSTLNRYFVLSAGLTGSQFRVSLEPGGTAVDTSGTQSGIQSVGKVTGRIGDQTFAVVAVGTNEIPRIGGSKFLFLGEEYIISAYEPETVTNQPYARITLDRPLVNSIIQFAATYTIKAAVPIRSSGSLGTLTIRISLTRVTSHDLLEIGTGSYADTNYPKEIYGPSVNALNPDTEVEERDVGRCFYVTTDQYGNFSVGPYFRVDQGTGQVTFSSSIALSNLDGIGFKRGVPISEFSTDSGFTDNATDTVPTENAARIYIERRLGVTHEGGTVVPGLLIPAETGGFLPLNGQLAMKGPINMQNSISGGFEKIFGLGNPSDPRDAVNLQSLTWRNFQNFSGNNIDASDILVFTGSGDNSVNASVVGDITFNLRPGVDSTLNQVDVQINADTIINADVKSNADIAQSKLLLNLASTRASAPTGTARDKQATAGVASFDSAQFTATDGFITVKDNGLVLSKIVQIGGETLLGNSNLSTGNVTAIPFSTIVNAGAAVKKSQYTNTGFLRRRNSSSFAADSDYEVIEMSSTYSYGTTTDNNKLIQRDNSGDFQARNARLERLFIKNDDTADVSVAIQASESGSGGFIQFLGWDIPTQTPRSGSILISNGTLPADRRTQYRNNLHEFLTQDGSSPAPITASSVQATTLTTGASGTEGTITGRWSLSSGSRLQATYSADLAEYYEGDKEYEVGTVLVFGGDKEVTTTTAKGDTRVAGVVSDNAAYTMYGACPGLKNLVALQGRVPCRVAGKIRKGDLLTTSHIPGVAVVATDPKVGSIVGKALQDYDNDHVGTIEIAVGRT